MRVENDNCPRKHGITRDQQHHGNDLRAVLVQVHPQTILGKGNSDPFQAFAISIDAPMADLLAYSRFKYLPEIFSHVNAPDVPAAVIRAFAETIEFLHDECTMYPQIAKIAAVMPKGSIAPEILSQIPVFKMKGLALLRKKLTNPDSTMDLRSSASMLLFLTAELYEGNLEAASVHARMIAHFLQTRIIPLNYLFLFSAMYDDTQRASFTLSRPAFDPKWVQQQLTLLDFTTIERLAGRSIAEACGPVDASITSPSLKAIVTEANHCSAVALLTSKSTAQIYTDNQLTYRFGCRRLACIGTIINRYIDSREIMRRNKRNKLNYLLPEETRLEAQICLALLYLMRREAKMDTFWIGAKFAVFSENCNILLSLKELLQQDEGNVDVGYVRVRLFALFVGAWAAYANTKACATYALVEKDWFAANFAAQVTLMGLNSWKVVHEVLVGFHFLEFLQPDGSSFWKSMSL